MRGMTASAPATTRVPGEDGVAVAVHRWASPGGQPPVVLQHGFVTGTRSNWVAPGLVAALLAAGRAVIGIDARGHGRSDKPHDPERYGEARMAADVRRVHDRPIPRHAVRVPTLVLAGDADPLAVRPQVLAERCPGQARARAGGSSRSRGGTRVPHRPRRLPRRLTWRTP
jgi:pimeloyl-ACP methyl ester carboxylesterase